MDSEIQTNIEELVEILEKAGAVSDDPVVKLMTATLVHQTQKIKDEISELPTKVVDRLSTYFIPQDKICACPAICYVEPSLKIRKGTEPHILSEGTYFSFKVDTKLNLTYHPLFRNTLLPFSTLHFLSPIKLESANTAIELNLPKKGQLWLGLELPMEVESIDGFSLFLKGCEGLLPQRICVDEGRRELRFSTADHLAEIPMMEPFDSQQVDPEQIETFNNWKNQLKNNDAGRLIYITDKTSDRDIFKLRAFPKPFQQMLESSDLDKFSDNTLWILLDFGDDIELPHDIQIIPNVLPAVNIKVNTLTLTSSSPIAKLTKDDGSFFLNVVESSLTSQKQGFGTIKDEVIIRDFDSKCYDASILHRDVRNLYNRFIEDYHAFVDYHSLKDGELIRSLRDIVNRIGKSVMNNPELKNRYDEGTYAMRSINLIGQPTTVKVTYLTTFGRLGNTPKAGNLMENKKNAAIEKEVKVIVSAEGGEDKASADQRYEMLRYYTLTSDRLFTKMDIDAFLRLQILKEFGKEEVKRISYDISIQGTGGPAKVVRGLYIDIYFRDNKNYEKARNMSLDRKLRQMIIDKSCISMPVMVKLVNSDTL